VGQLVIAALFLFGDETAESRTVGLLIALGGGLLVAVGLWKRLQSPGLGNALIIVGALFGLVWFWSLFLPLLAIIVIVGVIISQVRSPAPAVDTP
jgi:hypothetical protein